MIATSLAPCKRCKHEPCGDCLMLGGGLCGAARFWLVGPCQGCIPHGYFPAKRNPSDVSTCPALCLLLSSPPTLHTPQNKVMVEAKPYSQLFVWCIFRWGFWMLKQLGLVMDCHDHPQPHKPCVPAAGRDVIGIVIHHGGHGNLSKLKR